MARRDRLYKLRTYPTMEVYSDDFLAEVLGESEDLVRAYCRRTDTDGSEWDTPVVRLAAVLVNRLGAEGAQTADEGGIKRIWSDGDIPSEIRTVLKPRRLAQIYTILSRKRREYGDYMTEDERELLELLQELVDKYERENGPWTRTDEYPDETSALTRAFNHFVRMPVDSEPDFVDAVNAVREGLGDSPTDTRVIQALSGLADAIKAYVATVDGETRQRVAGVASDLSGTAARVSSLESSRASMSAEIAGLGDADAALGERINGLVLEDSRTEARVLNLERAGFVTNAVSNLVNYYKKTDTYTRAEVDALVAAVPSMTVRLVHELPTVGEANVLYLLDVGTEAGDVCDEYLYVNGSWERIGSTTVNIEAGPGIRIDSQGRICTADNLTNATVTSWEQGSGELVEVVCSRWNGQGTDHGIRFVASAVGHTDGVGADVMYGVGYGYLPSVGDLKEGRYMVTEMSRDPVTGDVIVGGPGIPRGTSLPWGTVTVTQLNRYTPGWGFFRDCIADVGQGVRWASKWKQVGSGSGLNLSGDEVPADWILDATASPAVLLRRTANVGTDMETFVSPLDSRIDGLVRDSAGVWRYVRGGERRAVADTSGLYACYSLEGDVLDALMPYVVQRHDWWTYGLDFDPLAFVEDPTGCLTYTGECAAYTPVTNPGAAPDAGSWDFDADPLLGGMFYATISGDGDILHVLDPYDLSKSVKGADVSAEIATENVMLCIPTLYTQRGPGGISLSNSPMRGTPWAHMRGGHTYKYTALGVYLGASVEKGGTERLMSVSGATPVNSLTSAELRALAQANGDGEWHIENFHEWALLRDLSLFLLKSFDSQGVLGRGLVSGGSSEHPYQPVSGGMDQSGPFVGNIVGPSPVKMLVEHPWGGIWQTLDDAAVLGATDPDGTMHVDLYVGANSNRNVTDTLSGKDLVHSFPWGGGEPNTDEITYSTAIGTSDRGWGLGANLTGGNHQGLCDQKWVRYHETTAFAVRAGGATNANFSAGVSALNLHRPFGYRAWSYGARPAFSFD